MRFHGATNPHRRAVPNPIERKDPFTVTAAVVATRLPTFRMPFAGVAWHVRRPWAARLPDLDQLLIATAGGDRAAFTGLYDAIAAAVFGTIRRVLRDDAMAEEVAQDVLLEVWRTAPRFDPQRGRATTWILTMAHRRAVDRVRSEQASRDRTERVGIAESRSAFDATAEEVVDLDERRRREAEVHRAMGAMTDLQRQAVELAYFDGHTYREVAELLDVPLGTVKTRMRDGLIRLRGALGTSEATS